MLSLALQRTRVRPIQPLGEGVVLGVGLLDRVAVSTVLPIWRCCHHSAGIIPGRNSASSGSPSRTAAIPASVAGGTRRWARVSPNAPTRSVAQ